MGTWIKGYKVSGGKLFDETLEGGGDLNDVTWQAAPDPSATSLYSCMGDIAEDGIFEGIDCLGVLKLSQRVYAKQSGNGIIPVIGRMS